MGISGGINAGDPSVWEKQRISVIVARVQEVQRQKPGTSGRQGTHKAVLVPLATIAGSFDPSLHPTLPVHLWAGPAGTSISAPPAAGDLILAVIQAPNNWVNSKEHVIVTDLCDFMRDEGSPIGSSIAVLKGLDDPKIEQTLKRIQDARLKTRDAATRPATRPAGP